MVSCTAVSNCTRTRRCFFVGPRQRLENLMVRHFGSLAACNSLRVILEHFCHRIQHGRVPVLSLENPACACNPGQKSYTCRSLNRHGSCAHSRFLAVQALRDGRDADRSWSIHGAMRIQDENDVNAATGRGACRRSDQQGGPPAVVMSVAATSSTGRFTAASRTPLPATPVPIPTCTKCHD